MNKNGFTLIELLAVIVILAIVALIATPIILGIIRDAKEQSTRRSAELYIDAVEQAIVRKNLEGEYNPEECKIEKGEVTCKGKFSPKYCKIIDGQLNCDGVPLEVEIDGEVPKDGTIVFQKGKAINGSELIFEGYIANINDKGEIVLGNEYKKYNDGDIVYFDIKEGKKCTNYHEDNSKTEYTGIYEGETSTKTTNNQNNCLKFYAFNDDGRDTLNLLLDHNTTAMILWSSSSSADDKKWPDQLNKDTASWSDQIKEIKLITAKDIKQITKNISWDESSAYYFASLKSSASETCIKGSITGCKFGWLYDRTFLTCTEYGCLNNSDIETYGYWTDTIRETKPSQAFYVYFKGNVNFRDMNDENVGAGIRPVITVPKRLVN